jgi:hypothetical protein
MFPDLKAGAMRYYLILICIPVRRIDHNPEEQFS